MVKKKLEEDIRIMKNNFARLETMYHDALEEVNLVKSEYEARLIKSHDEYTRVKTENEVLKEKVDVLFKLGRSYINQKENIKDKPANKKAQTSKADDDIEVMEESDIENENLQAWTTNKMRGFRRTNPTAASSTKAPAPPSKSTPGNSASSNSTSSAKAPPTQPQNSPPEVEKSTSAANSSDLVYTGKYCHYFVNS